MNAGRVKLVMLLEERENPKIVADLMGHVKVLTTLTTYSHVISDSVYESTAKTPDEGVLEIRRAKRKFGSMILPVRRICDSEIDSGFDSNADKFRQLSEGKTWSCPADLNRRLLPYQGGSHFYYWPSKRLKINTYQEQGQERLTAVDSK
jgi:hypothetical protein